MLGTIVNHGKYGEGIISNLTEKEGCNYYLTVAFADGEKGFAFPMCFERGFLTTNSASALEFIECVQKKKAQKEKEEAENRKQIEFQKKLEALAKAYSRRSIKTPIDENSEMAQMFRSPLTKDVEFSNDHDKFFAIGFIAGHVDKIIADMSEDREFDFIGIFGDVDRNVLNFKDGRSVCQLNLEFDKNTKFPEMLQEAYCEVHYGRAFTIPRSRFVFNLVKDYGFEFGDTQNVADIYKIVSDLGFAEDFEEGFMFK